MPQNRRFLLVRRPHGSPRAEDFALETQAIPPVPPGGILVRNHYASLDPAQRGWMDDAESYMPPIPLGDPVRAPRPSAWWKPPTIRTSPWASGSWG
jgi:NADPH-dependent curcumin reductase CurA